jgi:hypothetical protein
MCIWTSKALCGLAALILAGCVAAGPFGQKPRSAPILGGAVTIGVPAGYCIDRGAGREGDDTAVLIMGRCSDNQRALPAVITVSVGRSGSAGVMIAGGPALAAYFTSAEGLATLSRSGRAADVQVVQAVMAKDTFLLQVRDAQAGDYWRTVLGHAGRLFTISASGTPESPLSAKDSRKVLDQTVAALFAVPAG